LSQCRYAREAARVRAQFPQGARDRVDQRIEDIS
jgi:hypothetical protein